MQKLARVSPKGQVVIPAKLRRKLRISRTVMIREENGKIILEPSVPMEEAFGSGGKEMREVALEISVDRRKEVESERQKLSL
jgi:AbrB family looped-hinge helix DNA binding protein